GDRADFVHRLAAFVAMDAANVDSFMKAPVNDAAACSFRIAHESVLAALPRRRFLPVIIALDVLIKISRRGGTVKERVVVCRQNEVERRVFVLSLRLCKNESAEGDCKNPAHQCFFFSPMSRQSFFIKSIS